MSSAAKILICEDDFMTLKILEHSLKNAGYQVIMAKDGKEAMDVLGKGEADLLLTDIHLPYYNGLELIRYIRETLNSTIPVLVLSRVGLEDTMAHAFELGANDYLTKPFNPDELLMRLSTLINSPQ